MDGEILQVAIGLCEAKTSEKYSLFLKEKKKKKRKKSMLFTSLSL